MGSLSSAFFCMAPDLPGHGRSIFSETAGAYTMAETVGAVRGLLDREGKDACHVVGYSMGGRVALNLALETPERCLSLTLESVSPGIDDEAERAARRAQDEEWARRLEAGPFEEVLERWYEQPLFASLRHSPEWNALLARRRRNDAAHLARVLRGMGAATQRSLWPMLPALNLPILFVAGVSDEKYAAIGRRVAGLCKNARRIIVNGAGHHAHIERPGAFVLAVRKFIEEVKHD